MLDKIFLQILNMSFTASYVIIFVLIARLFLRKSPKIFSYALWSVVLFRLVCPFSFESFISLLPIKTTPISENIIYAAVPKIDTGIAVINNAVNEILPAAIPHASINPLRVWLILGETVWFIGIAFLLIYSIMSLLKLKKRLQNAVCEKHNIYLCESLDTPFVMGFFRPIIYLPANLSPREKQYILLHEQTHIKRFDHVIKIVCFFVLCLHWFNPLVWAAFFAGSRDMEMSCDEAVIKAIGSEVKKDYSSSLLTLATSRRFIGGTPLAFGEGDTKDRIKNVLNYKKPAFWAAAVSVIAASAIGIGLMANPASYVRLLAADTAYVSEEALDKAFYGAIICGDKIMEFSSPQVPQITEFIKELKVNKKEVSRSRDDAANAVNQIHLAYSSTLEASGHFDIYFNFNEDFTDVWVDNTIKPSFAYAVKDPGAVRNFFERQLNAETYPMEIGSAEELYKHRTAYIGDNAAVGNLIYLLPAPKGFTYDHFELHTTERPYIVEIVYNLSKETLQKYNSDETTLPNPFRKNALILLSLIDNADQISYVLTDGNEKAGFISSREWAENLIGGDVRAYAESPEKLKELIDFPLDDAAAPSDYKPAIMINNMAYWLSDNGGLVPLPKTAWVFGQIKKVSAPSMPPDENFEAIGLTEEFVGKDFYISPDGNNIYLKAIGKDGYILFVSEGSFYDKSLSASVIKHTNGKDTEKVIVTDKLKLNKLVSLLLTGNLTDKESVSDTPPLADYIHIAVPYGDELLHYYIYELDGKYYTEQPYNGIREISPELYKDFQSYLSAGDANANLTYEIEKIYNNEFIAEKEIINSKDFTSYDKKANPHTEEYAKFGIKIEDNVYYYNGERINVFMDTRADGSFENFFTDDKGTAAVHLSRDAAGAITKIEPMKKEELKEILDEKLKDTLNGLDAGSEEIPGQNLGNITRLDKSYLPGKIKTAVDACSNTDWYVIEDDMAQYIYYGGMKNNYGFELSKNHLRVVDIGKEKDTYVLLMIPKVSDLTISYQSKAVEFTRTEVK